MSKIIFLGDKSVGYGILSYLLETDKVKMVFTNSFHKTAWYPSIIDLCKKHHVFCTTENINTYRKYIGKPDFLVCAYYDKILSERVLKLAPAINVHMGLIQDYRGCYPTTFPIIDGAKRAGVTIHKMTEEIDGGEVYAQAEVSVDDGDTGQSLYYKCTGAAVDLFKKTWPVVSQGIIDTYHVEKTKRYIKRTDFPSHEIKLSWPKEKIDRYVRALTFYPFPKPYFVANGHKFEITYA